MSITQGIFEFLQQCPQLANLWSIAGVEKNGASVVLPQGASEQMQFSERKDVINGYHAEKTPFLTVFEDFQINCFKFYDTNDDSVPALNVNVLNYDEVRAVCDWITEQDENENFPNIGETVISISCEPFVPQITYINEQEGIIAYFITLRVRYLNRRKKQIIER